MFHILTGSVTVYLLAKIVLDFLQQGKLAPLFLARVDHAVESGQGATVVDHLGVGFRGTPRHLHGTLAPPGTRLTSRYQTIDQTVLVVRESHGFDFRLAVNGRQTSRRHDRESDPIAGYPAANTCPVRLCTCTGIDLDHPSVLASTLHTIL